MKCANPYCINEFKSVGSGNKRFCSYLCANADYLHSAAYTDTLTRAKAKRDDAREKYFKEVQRYVKRRAQINAWYRSGRSAKWIAEQEGITAQRVHQIVNRKKR